jgi:hypothetical protein
VSHPFHTAWWITHLTTTSFCLFSQLSSIHSLNTSENPQFKITNLVHKKFANSRKNEGSFTVGLNTLHIYIPRNNSHKECHTVLSLTCRKNENITIIVRVLQYRNKWIFTTTYRKSKAEFNFPATDCYKITVCFRSWISVRCHAKQMNGVTGVGLCWLSRQR